MYSQVFDALHRAYVFLMAQRLEK